MAVIPIVLSGGSGTRLWPFSRSSRPKQFLSFHSGRSLFQDTILRCRSELFETRPIVIGAEAHRLLMREDLEQIGVETDILLEPVPRNSCAAIAAGCFEASRRSPDAMVLVLAADHHVPDAPAFGAAVAEGCADAQSGYLITFGVRPDRPTTAYGYILAGQPLRSAAKVRRFLEKPPLSVAERLVAEGYLWNSGNFLFRADAYLDELEQLQPEIFSAVCAAWEAAERDLPFIRLGREGFERAPAISVDYAVMERTKRAAVLPVGYAWSDLGSWEAVERLLPSDAAGNAIVGDATVIEGTDNFIHSEGKLTALVGVDGLVVVSTRDSVLVVPKSQAEKVKSLVGVLQEKGRREASDDLNMLRPWGNCEQLAAGAGYQVRRLCIKPGGVVSPERDGDARHWIVVQGAAEIVVDGAAVQCAADQSVRIPPGSAWQIVNRGSETAVLIEVRSGSAEARHRG